MAQREIKIDDKIFNISYEIKRANTDRFALFLHGWGANKELMRACFEKTFEKYNHLYLDLPGFGNSDNRYVLDTFDYTKIIESFLENIEIFPEIIIAHSFGGKVALLLKPPKLVLLSSAGIPKIKSAKTKLKIKLAKICNFFGISSAVFRTKDAQNLPKNMYETLKKVVDEDFSEKFRAFKNELWIFWGKDDEVTPVYMADKIASLAPKSHLNILEGDHFFFLSQAKTIDRIVNE